MTAWVWRTDFGYMVDPVKRPPVLRTNLWTGITEWKSARGSALLICVLQMHRLLGRKLKVGAAPIRFTLTAKVFQKPKKIF